MRSILITILILATCGLNAQKRKRLDSLLAIEKNFKSDTTGIKNYISIAQKIKKINYDSALLYAHKAVQLTLKLNDTKFYFKSQFEKCMIIKSSGNYKQLSDSLLFTYNDPRLPNYPSPYLSFCLDLGVNYRRLSNFDKSIKFLLEALKIAQTANNRTGIYNCYNSLANTYSQSGVVKKTKNDLERALENYEKALKYIDPNNIELKGSILNNQGVTYFNIGQITEDTNATLKSITYYKLSLECRKSLKDSAGIANNYNNIGSAYHDLYSVSKNISFLIESNSNYERSIEIAEIIKLPELYTFNINYGGNLFNLAEKNKDKKLALKVIKYFKDAYLISSANGDTYSKMNSCDGLAKTFVILKQNDSAIIYYEKFIALKDTILNEENKQIAEDLTAKYESDLKDTENNNLKEQAGLREEVISRKSTTIKFMVVGSVLLLGLVLLVLVSRQKINKAKQLIELQKTETDKQKHIIEEKNKEIIDSINYAKRLQDAAIPSKDYFKSLLPNSFIYYQPKDIVAGDFYWIHKLKHQNKVLVTAADCTGHGVPGALVSIVCLNALNRCVDEFKLTQPAEILNKTSFIIQESFRQEENDVKDGMDISLILLDLDTHKGYFAGANNPIWIVKQNDLFEIKGDAQPVGKQHKPAPFTQHEFELFKNEMLVLFTDGYADQFGGEKGKKLKTKVFKEQLIALQAINIEDAKTKVEKSFLDWKGSLEQVDDVLVLGIRL